VHGPTAWNGSSTIYYVEFDWSAYALWTTRDLEFGLIAAIASDYLFHWNPTNDWSYQGITTTKAVTNYIPVYHNGVLVFGQEPTGSITPTPTATPSNTPTSTTGTTPTNTPVPTTSASVHYAITSSWTGGFTGSITITNTGTTTISGWTLVFTFTAGQTITQGWTGTFSQSGSTVTIVNASFNGTIAPGGSVNPGFNGTWTTTNPSPTAFTLNGQATSIV
jgi:hypothetical protein